MRDVIDDEQREDEPPDVVCIGTCTGKASGASDRATLLRSRRPSQNGEQTSKGTWMHLHLRAESVALSESHAKAPDDEFFLSRPAA